MGGCWGVGVGGVSVGHDLILLDRHERAEGHSKCAMIWVVDGPYSDT